MFSISNMAPSSSSSSSSSSSTTAWVYDVFLSFRGETRKSFTDHLYEDLRQAGINTFRDDEEIRKGENISAELLKAIEGSKMSIIVISKTYAKSRWCLDELVKILDCMKNFQQMVLPIFYHVDPSEVRKQTGKFGKALAQHRQRFDDQKVDEWKVALTTVSDLSGWDLKTTDGYESKFIKKITEEVLRKVNPTYMNVAKYPVGIESRVEDILHLLQTQRHDDIKMFGIFGMGGAGKTTLAKAIYNLGFQKFEGCCFIANIRSQASEGHNGLVHLQKKLLCKTLNRKKIEIDNVDEGIGLIKERLRSKRVLLVLDDIDDTSQLESLAGHRNWFGPGSTIIITTRDVQLLSDLEANEKYMVEALSPDESLQLLSLHAFDVPIPSKKYTELSQRIASYTVGLPLALTIIGSHLRGRSVEEWSDNAEKLRRTPNEKVQNILKISYDALDNDTKNIFLDIAFFFIGHNKNKTSIILEACDFYAKIGIKTLIERCLLTIDGHGEFGTLQMHDLIRDMGREIVQKESPREPGKQSRLIDPKDIFDVLHGNKGTKAIEGMIVNSNMLRNVPTQVFRRMKNLRILILDGMCLSGSIKYLPSELRLFRLHNCHLSCIPSDLRWEKLVELDMKDSNIKEFQCNMQHFRCLRNLKLDNCEQLKETPNFTGAHTLQEVSFGYCSNLVKVHPSIGSLERLVELHFYSCKKLKVLPSSICKLKSLEVLGLRYCEKLRELPIDDMGKFGLCHLSKLKKLWLDNLKNLRVLGELPPSLEILAARNCVSLKKIAGMSNLKRLEVLDISNCRSLVELSSFVELDISNCNALTNLKRHNLNGWQNLRSLPQLPPNLETLYAKNCVSLEKLADLSNMKRLRWLNIENCKSLVQLSGLESLESLQFLGMANCSGLRIPSIEKWLKACSEGDSVQIELVVLPVFSSCGFIMPLGDKKIFTNVYNDISGCNEIVLSARSKSSGAWILKEPPKYINIDKTHRHHVIPFVVPTAMMGEVLEVYAEFQPIQKIFCLFEIQRNKEGEVRLFPSTRGFIPSFMTLEEDDDGQRKMKRKRKLEIAGRGDGGTSIRQRRFFPSTRGLIPSVITLLGDPQRKRKRKLHIVRGGRSIRQRL